MAKVSFTFRKEPSEGELNGGSALQASLGSTVDDDSALRGDNYVSSPAAAATETTSFLEVTTIDYGLNKLTWGIGTSLTSPTDANPVPTAVEIRYDTIGEPQTVAAGVFVAKITPDRIENTITHGDLPEGEWVYYSLFVKYEGIGIRSWYEKVASIHVLMPRDYGSTDMLFRRIPRHYRIEDGSDSGPYIGISSPLFARGPLYRALDVFGWDIDKMRTLIDHQMVAKDPRLATPEGLDSLAFELGIPMSTVDLGTERLRNIVSDIGYLKQSKGTTNGVREWLTAIAGTDVEVSLVDSSSLTAAQSRFTGTVTVTSDPLTVPSGDEWVIEGTGITATQNVGGGLTLTKSSGTDYQVVVAKTKVSGASNALWYSSLLDILTTGQGSVIGICLSDTNIYSTDLYLNASTGYAVPPSELTGLTRTAVIRTEEPVEWYACPSDIGLVGDGTFTSEDMYLHIFMVFGSGPSTVTLDNFLLNSRATPDYSINIFTQRVNLFKDPQFHYAPTPFWGASTSGGTLTTLQSNRVYSTSPDTAASVTISNNGASAGYTPFRVGIPYFLSVLDVHDNISKVSLYSEQYGLVVEQTEPTKDQAYSDGSARKTWELFRPYLEPWLPKDLGDCYVVLEAYVEGGEKLAIKEPLLEPNNASSVYFDGDNVNGGWLAGEVASAGVADYRWGDAGQHQSCSYFTADYQRTVATLYRLLNFILPVTETGNPADILKLDRIYGYAGTDRP